MNQPTESEFLDDVGLKKPDRSRGLLIIAYGCFVNVTL
jgi:hypothetical protein